MRRILIVCTGNICRSPMAERVMGAALPGFDVSSAGTHALVGASADEAARALMQARGLPIDEHRARQLDARLCHEADLVLVMESAQRHWIQQRHPESTGKVFRLTERLRVDVPDPYRRTLASFQTALALIDQGAQAWAERISRVTTS
ncbi:MAG: protein tyrosine phosphatase [Variovorax paradoxus]|uniref:protein-tyrosine-phosphatase n=1 Tax=Variovorax paradoxus TaxID=34073 RepID=A0A2W5QJI7_VARPD|nr:MAG: protein tyrosine phosphatase [Variovorax paradoxus]